MPQLIYRIPSYRKHKASGQAIVTLNGQDHYLGTYGSAGSKREYQRLIAEWQAGGQQLAPDHSVQLTVAELISRFWRHVTSYYVKSGKPTSEQERFRAALHAVRKLYGHTAAGEFGPTALKAARQVWIDSGSCRSSVNKQTNRVRTMFKWGVENEFVPSSDGSGVPCCGACDWAETAAGNDAPACKAAKPARRSSSPARQSKPLLESNPVIIILPGGRIVCSVVPAGFPWRGWASQRPGCGQMDSLSRIHP